MYFLMRTPPGRLVQTLLLCCQVRPWVVDITADVQEQPETNEVHYHGYYQGKDPQPTGQPGSIMMQSNLVFYQIEHGSLA